MYFTQPLVDLVGMDYQIAYVDPPWTYRDKALAGNRGAGCKYPLMTAEALREMPVAGLCAKDALCFMWATYPKLDEALALMGAWGFAYKTMAFTWVKRTKNDKLFWGMGRWTRANPEIVILGTRGKPKRVSAGVHSVVEAPIGVHSVKPDEVRQRIVTLAGDVPRIELFARVEVDGWDAWGNEPEGPRTLIPEGV